MVCWTRTGASARLHQFRRAYLDPLLDVRYVRAVSVSITRRAFHLVLLVKFFNCVDDSVAVVLLLLISVKSVDHFLAILLG